jgi:hypothetical protein
VAESCSIPEDGPIRGARVEVPWAKLELAQKIGYLS